MRWLKRYLSSSVGRKQLMGLTGAFLYFYLIIHLLGNVGMLGGAEIYNKYSHLLLHNLKDIVVPIEIALLLAFVLHIYLAIKLSAENRAARPVRYAAPGKAGGKTLASSTMLAGGLIILVFTLIHVPHFKYGVGAPERTITYEGVEMRDLYGSMMAAFSHWWYTAFYVLAMLFIGLHLRHGFQSSLQSLGLNHRKYTPLVRWISIAYGILIGGGFSALAIWAYFQHGGIG